MLLLIIISGCVTIDSGGFYSRGIYEGEKDIIIENYDDYDYLNESGYDEYGNYRCKIDIDVIQEQNRINLMRMTKKDRDNYKYE